MITLNKRKPIYEYVTNKMPTPRKGGGKPRKNYMLDLWNVVKYLHPFTIPVFTLTLYYAYFTE